MEPNQPKNITAPIIFGSVFLLFTVAAGVWVFAYSSSTNSSNNSSANISITVGVNPIQSNPNSTYKDGTYSSNGSYYSPDGVEQLGVAVTLTNDVITNVDFTIKSRGTSGQYQQMYVAGAKSLIIGKSINSDFNFSSVNGASLTNQGFISALDNIKSQAKA